jgi:uncharacterized protein YcbK (DUF882 family)
MKNDFRIAPDFLFSEFLVEGDPLPNLAQIENLRCLANRLQVIRDVLNRPIKINSAFRTVQHNKSVGGSKNSMHLHGMAADIVVIGISPDDFRSWARNWSGGMGSYRTFTHIDIRPDKARWG